MKKGLENAVYAAFNRTILELKYNSFADGRFALCPFNRTILELKSKSYADAQDNVKLLIAPYWN